MLDFDINPQIKRLQWSQRQYFCINKVSNRNGVNEVKLSPAQFI